MDRFVTDTDLFAIRIGFNAVQMDQFSIHTACFLINTDLSALHMSYFLIRTDLFWIRMDGFVVYTTRNSIHMSQKSCRALGGTESTVIDRRYRIVRLR